MICFVLQAGTGRKADDHLIIELQQRIRDLQDKLDSVGVYEVRNLQHFISLLDGGSTLVFKSDSHVHDTGIFLV